MSVLFDKTQTDRQTDRYLDIFRHKSRPTDRLTRRISSDAWNNRSYQRTTAREYMFTIFSYKHMNREINRQTDRQTDGLKV